MIALRNGIEVARTDEVAFNIATGGRLTESSEDLTVADR
jgi:hypothetical protein